MKKLLINLFSILILLGLFLLPKMDSMAANTKYQLVLDLSNEDILSVNLNGKVYSSSTILNFSPGTDISIKINTVPNRGGGLSVSYYVSLSYDIETCCYYFKMPSSGVIVQPTSFPCLDGNVILKSEKNGVETIYKNKDDVVYGTILSVSLANSSTTDTSKLRYRWVYADDSSTILSTEPTYKVTRTDTDNGRNIRCLVESIDIPSSYPIPSVEVHPVGPPGYVYFEITGPGGIILDNNDKQVINSENDKNDNGSANPHLYFSGSKVGFYIAEGYTVTSMSTNSVKSIDYTINKQGDNYYYFEIKNADRVAVKITFDSTYDYETVIIDCPDLTYEGEKEYAPDPVVKTTSGRLLKKETDYKIGVSNTSSPTKAGRYLAWARIYKNGNYYYAYFTFNVKANTSANASLKSSSIEYTGSTVKPEVKISSGLSETLVEGRDYDITYPKSVEIGSYTLTVNFKRNYSGSKKLTYKIVSCKSASVKLKSDLLTYTGKKINPVVLVSGLKGQALKEKKDYTVKYASSSKEIGKYKVTVTFKGNYTGSKTVEYYIVPKNT